MNLCTAPREACGVFLTFMNLKMISYTSLQRYLKELGIYRLFVENVRAQRGCSVDPATVTDLKTAFDWDATPEGAPFWCVVSDDYDDMVAATTVRKIKQRLYYGDDDGRPD